jgi:hypothetical protein
LRSPLALAVHLQARMVRSTILAVLLVACAAAPPRKQLDLATGSIRTAEHDGASAVPRAALYLQLAQEQTHRARDLIAAGGEDNMKAANRLLLRAQADGELARVIAEADHDRVAAAQAIERVEALEAGGAR